MGFHERIAGLLIDSVHRWFAAREYFAYRAGSLPEGLHGSTKSSAHIDQGCFDVTAGRIIDVRCTECARNFPLALADGVLSFQLLGKLA